MTTRDLVLSDAQVRMAALASGTIRRSLGFEGSLDLSSLWLSGPVAPAGTEPRTRSSEWQ
jgi:hypothetical protein